MSIDIHDYKFAIASEKNSFNGFATAGDCLSSSCEESSRKGKFQADLNGTNFLLPSQIPYVFYSHPVCVQKVYKPSMSSDRRRWSGLCGGYCGNCWPKKMYVLIEAC